jgi:hypothetical protein
VNLDREALVRARALLSPRHHEWGELLPWLENVIAEHGKRPFHAVIAASNSSDPRYPRDATEVILTGKKDV